MSTHTASPPLVHRELVVVLGIPFDNLTMDEAVERIAGFVRDGRTHLVATANVNFVVQAGLDPEFRDVVRMADMITADGMPVVWASKLFGTPLKERVTGSDMSPRLATLAARNGWRMFILGGAPGVGEIAAANLRATNPGLEIGCYSPAFDPLLEMNFASIKAELDKVKPHILLVSLGAGKAEKFMRMYRDQLGAAVTIGVGATVDFLAGRVKRAPLWVQRHGLEWVYRGFQEPRRLVKRYVHDFPRFTFPVLRQWWTYRRARAAAEAPGQVVRSDGAGWVLATLEASGRLEGRDCAGLCAQAREVLGSGKPVALLTSKVTFMDSSSLGSLVGVEKNARTLGLAFFLVAPSDPLKRLLHVARLDDLFRVVDSVTQAEAQLLREASTHPLIASHGPGPDRTYRIRLKGRIDADATPRLIETLNRLVPPGPGPATVELDMTDVAFIDSSGLKVVIGLHRRLNSEHRTLRIPAMSPNVARLFAIVRIDRYLNIG